MRIHATRGQQVVQAALLALLVVVPLPAVSADPAQDMDSHEAAWLQWGGPTSDFRAPVGEIAASWPADGPPELWSRRLGEGYSAILVAEGRLYTMYRVGEQEAVVCLDARSGETLWEQRYDYAWSRIVQKGYGVGPRSTPAIAGELLFTVGGAGEMHALRKSDGKILWRRDLWGEELAGNRLGHGYSSSPLAYGEVVIVPVGGPDAGLIAFDQNTGEIVWRTPSSRNSYSSPRLVHIAGEAQILVFMAEELVALDPESGELRWRYPHANQWRQNISPPLVTGDDTIFLSSPQIGARGLRLVRDGNEIEIEETWASRRVQFYHGSSVRMGAWVYGSTGTTSPAFMTAIDTRTGEIGWKERGFAKANCVEADGKLIVLDEDGMLYLATATPEELIVHSRTQLLDRVAWTVPTIVGATLYVRDNQRIMALDLS